MYKQGIDRTLIRENLRKSYDERLLTLERMQGFVREVRRAGEALRDQGLRTKSDDAI